MDTREMLDLVIRHERGEYNPKIEQWVNLSNAADVFAFKAYKDIKRKHSRTNKRGFSFSVETSRGKFTILTYEVAARIMITIRDEKDQNSVSLVGSTDRDNIAGLHAIHGSVKKAISMLDYFTQQWYTVKLKSNKNVSMI